jgi:hypothetical protein
MKLIFTFPPPRLRRTIIPLKNPKNLSEQTGPPQTKPILQKVDAQHDQQTNRLTAIAVLGKERLDSASNSD